MLKGLGSEFFGSLEMRREGLSEEGAEEAGAEMDRQKMTDRQSGRPRRESSPSLWRFVKKCARATLTLGVICALGNRNTRGSSEQIPSIVFRFQPVLVNGRNALHVVLRCVYLRLHGVFAGRGSDSGVYVSGAACYEDRSDACLAR